VRGSASERNIAPPQEKVVAWSAKTSRGFEVASTDRTIVIQFWVGDDSNAGLPGTTSCVSRPEPATTPQEDGQPPGVGGWLIAFGWAPVALWRSARWRKVVHGTPSNGTDRAFDARESDLDRFARRRRHVALGGRGTGGGRAPSRRLLRCDSKPEPTAGFGFGRVSHCTTGRRVRTHRGCPTGRWASGSGSRNLN